MKFFTVLLLTFIFAESSLAKPAEKAEEKFTIDQIESIMLDDEVINKINQAFDLFGQGKEFTAVKTADISDEEKERLAKQKLSEEMKLIQEKSRIYLGSILYFSDKIWSIWINEKKITASSNKKGNELFIKRINGQRVKILWTLGVSKWKVLMGTQITPKVNALNQIEINITLRPNQTFLLRENKIIEGNTHKKLSATNN